MQSSATSGAASFPENVGASFLFRREYHNTYNYVISCSGCAECLTHTIIAHLVDSVRMKV